jgi:hypothetical protein
MAEANGRPLRVHDERRIMKAEMKTVRAVACRGLFLSRSMQKKFRHQFTDISDQIRRLE